MKNLIHWLKITNSNTRYTYRYYVCRGYVWDVLIKFNDSHSGLVEIFMLPDDVFMQNDNIEKLSKSDVVKNSMIKDDE